MDSNLSKDPLKLEKPKSLLYNNSFSDVQVDTMPPKKEMCAKVLAGPEPSKGLLKKTKAALSHQWKGSPTPPTENSKWKSLEKGQKQFATVLKPRYDTPTPGEHSRRGREKEKPSENRRSVSVPRESRESASAHLLKPTTALKVLSLHLALII